MVDSEIKRGPALIASVLFLLAIVLLAYNGFQGSSAQSVDEPAAAAMRRQSTMRPDDDEPRRYDRRGHDDRPGSDDGGSTDEAGAMFEVNAHCTLHYIATPAGLKAGVRPDSIDVVFVHGADQQLQSAEYWQPLVDELDEHVKMQYSRHAATRTVGHWVRVSLPGHGKSTPATSPLAVSNALAAFLNNWLSVHSNRSLVLVARSAGARHLLTALNSPALRGEHSQRIVGVVLIAPAVVLAPSRLSLSSPLLLVWHTSDPVVPFARHTDIEKTCARSDIAVSALYISDQLPHADAAAYHMPEMHFSSKFAAAFFRFLRSDEQPDKQSTK